ncbi:C2H2 transcription factor [Metarhizium robertsii ARSEF 23]|uniref:C2H2 transcription factor n=1 Tax=Metarhizium robertsii (strain ARSEF 23 / ATCC MYA-3075) TaxID=655844 RepID=E9F498_METRA|nr:C2H2 transcription factor [Metarhizium robertsii ARSEF 23]EFY97455.2 C2H2 transcription factor [Metarhizium robertsii ARSEF 23]
MASNAAAMFSFAQTEPSTDLLNGQSWGSTSESHQNFQDFPDNGSSHSGEAEDYLFTSGHTTPRGSRLEQAASMDSVWTNPRTTQSSVMAQAMARADSSRSSGSSLSQHAQLSRGNVSAFRNVSHAAATTAGTMAGMNSCLLVAADAHAVSSNAQMYWPEMGLDMNIAAGGGSAVGSGAFAVTQAGPMHMVPAHMHLGPESVLPDNSSPGSWDCFSSSISRTSSPATVDDVWLPSALSPNSSPEIVGDSPRYVEYFNANTEQTSYASLISSERKVSMASDKDTIVPKIEEGVAMPHGYPSRRHGSDGESSARDHRLYKNVTPGPDGLFHCPWEGQSSCNHKPEKLKCNYDKFVDSHLKPYRCKADSCEGARFSSTACLLRHEREAHGLHGHGDKPFLCVYEGCERAVQGNGFPRQWNLRDHMKRVHNDHGSSSGSPPATANGQSAKGRKRKTEVAEPQNGTRKATLKSMPVADSKQVSSKPLLEQWLDQRRAVEDLCRSLSKPDDARNLGQIHEMQKHLSIMAHMTSSVTSPDIRLDTNRRNYTTG